MATHVELSRAGNPTSATVGRTGGTSLTFRRTFPLPAVIWTVVAVAAGICSPLVAAIIQRRNIAALAAGIALGAVSSTKRIRRALATSDGEAQLALSLRRKRKISPSSAGLATPASAPRRKRVSVLSAAGVALANLSLLVGVDLAAACAAGTAVSATLRRRLADLATNGVNSATFAAVRRKRRAATSSTGAASPSFTTRRERIVALTSAGLTVVACAAVKISGIPDNALLTDTGDYLETGGAAALIFAENAPAVTYWIEERCDTGLVPTNVTWTGATSNSHWDEVGLNGTYSLAGVITNVGVTLSQVGVSNPAVAYWHAIIQVGTTPAGTVTIGGFRTSGGSAHFLLRLRTDLKLGLYGSGGDKGPNTDADALTLNVPYRVLIKYVKGGTGFMTFKPLSDTGAFPTSGPNYLEWTPFSPTAEAGTTIFGGMGASSFVDDMLVGPDPIPANP